MELRGVAFYLGNTDHKIHEMVETVHCVAIDQTSNFITSDISATRTKVDSAVWWSTMSILKKIMEEEYGSHVED